MEGGTTSGGDAPIGAPNDLSARLVDAFFRRWFLYLLPILVFGAFGVYSATGLTGQFSSYARLSATTNPFVSQPTIRGTELAYYESPAGGTARLINEQLQTDAFIDDVADRAGLTDALNAGLLTHGQIRQHIGASPVGTNNLSVSASWDDAQTAFVLVGATIEGYSDYLIGIASADTAEAVNFWSSRLADANTELDAADLALDDYLASYPEGSTGDERPTEQVLEIQRLNSSIDRALDNVRAAQTSIDGAEFAESQARSESSRQTRVVDPPTVPFAPSSVRREQVTSVTMFSLLGLTIAFGALFGTTALDHSVRTRAQVSRVSGITSVATIPRLKSARQDPPFTGVQAG